MAYQVIGMNWQCCHKTDLDSGYNDGFVMNWSGYE